MHMHAEWNCTASLKTLLFEFNIIGQFQRLLKLSLAQFDSPTYMSMARQDTQVKCSFSWVFLMTQWLTCTLAQSAMFWPSFVFCVKRLG